jgi:hypothetical protein
MHLRFENLIGNVLRKQNARESIARSIQRMHVYSSLTNTVQLVM